MTSTALVARPVEGEASLSKKRRAEREVGGACDLRALIEEVIEQQGSGPAGAEVVTAVQTHRDEVIERVDVGTVVVGAASGP